MTDPYYQRDGITKKRRRAGQALSLREARQIALQLLADLERELQEEREAESRFWLSMETVT
jgi:hypothetical protein